MWPESANNCWSVKTGCTIESKSIRAESTSMGESLLTESTIKGSLEAESTNICLSINWLCPMNYAFGNQFHLEPTIDLCLVHWYLCYRSFQIRLVKAESAGTCRGIKAENAYYCYSVDSSNAYLCALLKPALFRFIYSYGQKVGLLSYWHYIAYCQLKLIYLSSEHCWSIHSGLL